MYEGLDLLIREYRDSLKGIRHIKHEVEKRIEDKVKSDKSLINSMERDILWSIEYMSTGYMPAYSIGQYKKIVPVDPQKVMTICSKPLISNKPSSNGITEFLHDLFKVLTSNEREALMLVVIEGITYEEAAEFMKVTKGSVSSYVDRAKNKIRSLYVKRGWYE